MSHDARLLTAVGLVLAFAAPAGTALARQATPAPVQHAEARETPESRAVSRAVEAAELAALGRQQNNPDMLREAARMLAELPMRLGQGGDPGLTPVLAPDSLLQEATALADNGTIDDVV